MDAYCKKQGINRTSVSFHFDGKRIEDDKAAAEVTVFCRGAVLLAVFHFTVCILIALALTHVAGSRYNLHNSVDGQAPNRCGCDCGATREQDKETVVSLSSFFLSTLQNVKLPTPNSQL